MKKNHSTITFRSIINEHEVEKNKIYERYRFLRSLTHKKPFVKFVDFIEGDRDISYLVCSSSIKSLRDEIDYCVVKKRRVTKKRIWGIFLDSLLCLSSLHKGHNYLGVLSPELIRVDKMGEGRIKIDVAFLLESIQQKLIVKGTAPYISPELFAMGKFSSLGRVSKGLTDSSDIWSLGVICLEYLLTNKLPLIIDESKKIPQVIYLNLIKFLIFVQSMAPWIVKNEDRKDFVKNNNNNNTENHLINQKIVKEAIKKRESIDDPLRNRNRKTTSRLFSSSMKKKTWSGLDWKDTRPTGMDVRAYRSAIRRLQKTDRFLCSLVFRMCCFDPNHRPSLETIVSEVLKKYLSDVKENERIELSPSKQSNNKEEIINTKVRPKTNSLGEGVFSLVCFESKIRSLLKCFPHLSPTPIFQRRKETKVEESSSSNEETENNKISSIEMMKKKNKQEIERMGEDNLDECLFEIPRGDIDDQLEEFYLKWRMYYEKKKILKYLEQRRELFTDPLIFRTNPLTSILNKRVLPSPPTSPLPPGMSSQGGDFVNNNDNNNNRVTLKKKYSVLRRPVVTVNEYLKKQLKLPFNFFYNWHSRKFDDYAISIAVPRMLKHVNGLFNYNTHLPSLFNTILIEEIDNDESFQNRLVSELRPLLIGFPRTKKSLESFLLRERVIPAILRPEVWRCLLVGGRTKGSLKESFQKIPCDFKTLYDKQIKVDIVRCHQYHLFLKSARGKEKLLKVLKSFCIHNNYCYVQGLDSVCAPFLCLFPQNPEIAYFCFRTFVGTYLKGYFLQENFTEEIDRNLHIFELLLQEHELTVLQKLRSVGLQLQSFSLAWMLTLFSHSLTIESIYKLWDFVMIQSLEEEKRRTLNKNLMNRKEMICMYIAVSYLKLMKKQIMTASFSEVIRIFKDLNAFDVNVVIKMTRELMSK